MADGSDKQFVISMPPELVAQVRKEAHDMRISVSRYIRLMHKHRDIEKVSRDSEIAEVGRALREHAREQKDARRKYWEGPLQSYKSLCPTRRVTKVIKVDEYYWQFILFNGRMDFWPSSGKYFHTWMGRSGTENRRGHFANKEQLELYIKENVT